jgi:hypothetical protein
MQGAASDARLCLYHQRENTSSVTGWPRSPPRGEGPDEVPDLRQRVPARGKDLR